MTKRKRLLVDLDNTITDLYGEWLGVYNRLHNRSVQKSDITTWDIHDHVPDGGEIYKILEMPEFFRRPKPLGPSIEAIERVSEVVQVIICSAAHAEVGVASDKMWWLRYHMPFIPVKDIMFVYHKQLIRADGLIDDGPHNITKYHAEWPSAKIWSIRWPYNAHLSHIAQMYHGDYRDTTVFWDNVVRDITVWADEE